MAGRIAVGTSGWHYRHWIGRLYPPDLAADRWLAHYSARFAAVEVNNTFYRLPAPAILAGWRASTPPGFLFTVKASRFITHFHRLKPRWDRYGRFFQTVPVLGDRLGPLLFQLPPGFPPEPGRLDDFLAMMPPGFRAAFEFRDRRWLCDAVLRVLEARRAALVFWDFEGERPPWVETADFVYVRLHGPGARYRGAYDDSALEEWAERLWRWSQAGKPAFCFFDNDDKAYAVTDAARLVALLQTKGPDP